MFGSQEPPLVQTATVKTSATAATKTRSGFTGFTLGQFLRFLLWVQIVDLNKDGRHVAASSHKNEAKISPIEARPSCPDDVIEPWCHGPAPTPNRPMTTRAQLSIMMFLCEQVIKTKLTPGRPEITEL